MGLCDGAVVADTVVSIVSLVVSEARVVLAPPAAGRGLGGLVLPGETAAHASETFAYSGICCHVIAR